MILIIGAEGQKMSWTFRSIWCFTRRAFLLLGMTALISASLVDDGRAQQPQSFQDGFRQVFASMMNGILSSNCLNPQTPKPYNLGFLGIAPNDIHITETIRADLNNRTQRGIEESSVQVNVNAIQPIGDLARLSSGDRQGQQEIQNLLNRQYSSALLLKIETKRPAVDRVQLEFNLYGRSERNAYDCVRSEVLYVQLPDYTIADSNFDRLDLTELTGAYFDMLQKTLPEIQSVPLLTFDTEFNMSGLCPLIGEAKLEFSAFYFDAKSRFGAQLSGKWPDYIEIKDDEALAAISDDALIMQARFSLSPLSSAIANLTIDLKRKSGVIKARQTYKTVVPQEKLQGCFPALADTQRQVSFLERLISNENKNGAKFTIELGQNQFVVQKDPVKLFIKAEESLYLYCWYLGEDGTAYVVYPATEEENKTPWQAGETRLFPGDFSDESYVYPAPAKELFGCYARRTALPAELASDWIKAHHNNEGGNGPSKELTPQEVFSFTERLNQIPDTGNDYAWIVAVDEQ